MTASPNLYPLQLQQPFSADKAFPMFVDLLSNPNCAFPYKSYYSPKPAELYKNLCNVNYVINFPEDDKNNYTFQVSEMAYNGCDLIADLYTEDARLRSSINGKLAPMQIWSAGLGRRASSTAAKAVAFASKHTAEIARLKPEQLGAYILREMLYEISSECTQFKPSLTKAIVTHLAGRAGVDVTRATVLDPCAGWGDRLIGCRAAGVANYIGVDPNPLLHPCYEKMVADLPSATQTQLQCLPFEDFVCGQPVDIVFTSPPFSNYEMYFTGGSESLQSNVRHAPDVWAEQWLYPMVEKMWSCLRPGGVLALYLSDTRVAGGRNVCRGLVDHMAAAGMPLLAQMDCQREGKRPLPLWTWRRPA